MATNAFIAGTTIKIGDAASPEVFTAIPECVGLSGLGKTNDLVEATHFGSSGEREYIAGLADGSEVSAEFNYLPGQTQLDLLKTQVTAGTTTNFQVEVTDGTNTDTFAFAAVPLSWTVNPQLDDKNTISYALKITGAITES